MQMETLPPKYLKPIFVTGKTINLPSSSPLLQKYLSMVQSGAGASITTSTEAYTTGTETFSAGVESYSAGAEAYTAGAESYSAGAEAFTGGESYAAEGGAEAFTGGESYAAGAEAFTGGESYAAGAEAFTGGEEFAAGGESYAAGAEAFTGGEEFGAGAEAGAEAFGGAEFGGESAGAFGESAGAGSVDLSSSGYNLIRRGSGITQNEETKIAQTAVSIVQQGLTPISNKTASAVKQTLGGDWLVIVYPQDKPIDFNMTCVQGNDYMYFTLAGNAYQVCRLR